MTLYVDIETYSVTSLKDAGVYRYAEDPTFLILMAGWAVDDGPVVVSFGDDIYEIPGLFDRNVIKVAHNAQFERICFSEYGYGDSNPPYLPAKEWHDTAAVAGELGYPQKLETLAVALGAEKKDEAGTALINWFCKPDRNGQRRLPEDHWEKWAQFVEYCRQDVVALRDVHRRLGDFPTETERSIYLADQCINDRGMAIDVDMAHRAVVAAGANQALQIEEAQRLTGVDNPNSTAQLSVWLRDSGLRLPNLRVETVEAALSRPDLTETQRRVLELRQELALIASKKFRTALESVCSDGRLRGNFRFFGAHTGRWTGKGVQPQNLPREQLPTETATEAAIVDLKLGLGAEAQTLKALVRALFIGPFTVVDFASIEARVIAWMANERWALDAFYKGRDIYVETAERMGGLTRSQGKVAVLALGYNGGIASLRAMGAEGDDRQLQFLVDQWRLTNPGICGLWGEMGDAFRYGGSVGQLLAIEKCGTTRLIHLPSGRSIGYHDVRYKWVETKFGRRQVASFASSKFKGARDTTYGGRLSENVTQAIARDVMAEALCRLLQSGYDVVAHVHDEILVEGEHPVEAVSRIMVEQPTWAKGLPIDATGFTCNRYRKGV